MEWVDKYKGKFDDGYEAYREWVLARMIDRGIMPEDTQLTQADIHAAKSYIYPINPFPI